MVQIAVSRSVLSVVLWLSLFHAVGGSAGECSCRVSWRECKILWIRSGSDSHTFRRNLCQVERRMAGTAEDVHAQSPGQGHRLACREITTTPPPPPPPPPSLLCTCSSLDLRLASLRPNPSNLKPMIPSINYWFLVWKSPDTVGDECFQKPTEGMRGRP